ncbi:endospore germination permease [Bacillus sp. DNRA2]|uniref:endospore germination permease n=1 Tax=Bacillus sp. DNRA2 TaxID=2723053 RepID=UPI00145F7716|nr:endospore germination permease [Bacillus sp. DNRA2]
MNNANQISIFQIILLIITAVGLKNHVFAIPPLIQTAKKDSWMSVLLALVITLVWIWIILAIHKKTNRENIFTWLMSRGNKWVVYSLIGLLIISLTLMVAATLRETVTWIHITLLPETPKTVTAIALGFVCLMMANTNLKSICVINQFLLFFVIIFGFFVAIVNMQYKDYSLLKPIFEHGYAPILKGTIFPLSGFFELFLVLLMQDKIREKFSFKQFAITAILLTGLTIGPLVGAIIEFSQGEAEKQRFPAYEEWELVSIGHFIEHIFFFVIYQWLTGAYIRISFLFFLIRELFSLNNQKIGKYALFTVFVLVEILTLYPLSAFQYNS